MDDYGGYELAVMDQQHEIDYNEWLRHLEDKMNENQFSVDPKEWEAALNDLTAQDGIYLFPEKGDTRVRLLKSPERAITLFYQPVVTTFHDKARTRYMIPVLAADHLGNYSYDIKYAVVAKTVVQGILELLSSGYDLLSPDRGHGITIKRTGEGLGTRYTVIPSPDIVEVDYAELDFPMSLLEMADGFVEATEEAKDTKTGDDLQDIPF